MADVNKFRERQRQREQEGFNLSHGQSSGQAPFGESLSHQRNAGLTFFNVSETVQRLSFAMETASLGIWDWTPETNTIYFDDGYSTIAGYTPGEFPATIDEWRARMHPDDLERVREGLCRLGRGEEDANKNPFRFKTRSGTWMWILGRAEKAGVKTGTGRDHPQDNGQPGRLLNRLQACLYGADIRPFFQSADAR